MKRIWQKAVSLAVAAGLLLSDWGSGGFAAPAIVTRELTASDRQTYEVTVQYDTDPGLPRDLALQVRELAPEEDGAYDDYVDRSLELLGKSREELRYARAFDIALTDPATGQRVQPRREVEVRIRLLGTPAAPETDVVHFGDQPQVMDCAVAGETVAFSAQGFSVYVVTGSGAVYRRTYKFYVPREGVYGEFQFTDEDGRPVASQTVKDGERPVVPQPPVNEDLGAFAGWYEGTYQEGGEPVFADEPYDFDHLPALAGNVTVDLFARYRGYATGVFHDQYDAATGTFPITQIRRVPLEEGDAPIPIDDVKGTYYGSENLGFYGWSLTPITEPGAALDDAGDPAQPILSSSVDTDDTVELYPIYKRLYWLSFYAGPARSGASYVPSRYYFDGEGPTSLPVPTRKGYTFQGWYTGQNNGDEVAYGQQVTDGEGLLLSGVSGGGVTVSDGRLLQTQDVMLYARWAENASSVYRVAFWTQKASGEGVDFLDADVRTGPTGSQAAVSEADRALEGYEFVSCDDPVTITNDGAAVLNVYFRPTGETPEPTGEHELRFMSQGVETAAVTVSAGAPLEAYGFTPDAPAHYQFNGWFLDPDGVLPADLSEMTMPHRDLTLYAGWVGVKYRVRIDPNYGSLQGTGATWFNNRIDDDLIQEYIQVRRDYVPSSSGDWYYVNHDWARYYGGDPPDDNPDRSTYYTQDPTQATEYTTFEYAPGYYRYDGWYEVYDDGTEASEPYDFTRHTDHDTQLRLHWKKAGTYFVEYDPGEGELTADVRSGALARVLDGAGYTDAAQVAVINTAKAPAGYAFTGWRLRGDASGRLYGLGETFSLPSALAKSISGREIVTLDAVYQRIATARIIYNANGGTVSENADCGALWRGDQAGVESRDPAAGTAALSGLPNNSSVRLSSGEGFQRAGARLAGWSDRPVADATAPLYLPGEEYAVDSDEPVTLYAVWETEVRFHLNHADTRWGEAWLALGMTPDGDGYTAAVRLGEALPEPAAVPEYTGDGSLMFFDWRTTAAGDAGSVYDFTLPVTGPLELYAHWEGPVDLPVHGVDATAETLADGDGWLLEDAHLSVGRQPVALTPDALAGLFRENQLPAGMEFAFVAAHDSTQSLDTLSAREAVTQVVFSEAAKGLEVTYADGSAGPVGETTHLYLVYYARRALPVGYRAMDAEGALTAQAVAAEAPAATPALGALTVSDLLTAPLTYPTADDGPGYFAYAVGPADLTQASQLQVITPASDGGHPPALAIRNTWRGFEYALDGETWTGCGYAPTLYVLYFAHPPRMITIGEETLGAAAVRDAVFSYRVELTDVSGETETLAQTLEFTLSHGETKTIAASYRAGDTPTAQRVTVTQTPHEEFNTQITAALGAADPETLTWTYTTTGTDQAPAVTFTNGHKALAVEIHVAVAEQGRLVRRDDLRAGETGFSVPLGEQRTFLWEVASSTLFTGGEEYAFAGVTAAAGEAGNGSLLTPSAAGLTAIAYARTAPESPVYALTLRDGKTVNRPLEDGEIFYVYYKMPALRYAKADAQGNLSPIAGAGGGLTYNGNSLTMNGQAVVQDQRLAPGTGGMILSQAAGNRYFHLPPLLDDGTRLRYLSYAKLGVGDGSAAGTGDLSPLLAGDPVLHLALRDNALQVSADGENWTPLGEEPVLWAVYEERGYDLILTKTVDTAQSGPDPVLTGRSFPVTLRSTGITKESYEVEGGDALTVSATPATASAPGTLTVNVRDGSKVKIKGLGQGEYTLTEGGNQNYVLSAKVGRVTGAGEETSVADNAALTLQLDTEMRAELTNRPRPICKIVDSAGAEHLFYTLTAAVNYTENHMPGAAAQVEMLTDYAVPAGDAPEIPRGVAVTLTTATEGASVYQGQNAARITRTAETAGVPLFLNNGTLTLDTVTLDGLGILSPAPLVENRAALAVGEGAALTGGNSTGSGGAITSYGGTVSLEGRLEQNQAHRGGAVWLEENAELTVSGAAQLRWNHAAASGGAIAAASGTVAFSGSPSLGGNTAGADGGAVYGASAAVTVQGTTNFTANEALRGGAIFVGTGSVKIAGGTLTRNRAEQSGGAVYLEDGQLELTGGSLTGNRVAAGESEDLTGTTGGAVTVEKGSATLSGGTLSGNSADNGAALFVTGGSAILKDDLLITGNTAGAGGAVGFEQRTVRLTFSGGVQVTGNTHGEGESPEAANVYLDLDTDAVLNAAGLGETAVIGVYVPGPFEGELFRNRGIPGSKFASYTSADNLSAFANDRQPVLDAVADTSAKRAVWGKALKVEVRWLPNYTTLPSVDSGQRKYSTDSFYPASSDESLSQLAAELYNKVNLGLTRTAAYGGAFLSPGDPAVEDFQEMLTHLHWDPENQQWVLTRWDETTLALADEHTVVIFYAEPAYINLQNNTDAPLNVAAMTVNGRPVISSPGSVGYGFVFARNGAIRRALVPVKAEDLVLPPQSSLNLLIPGGRNMAYALTGSFPGAGETSIRLRRTQGSGTTEETVAPQGFTLTGTTLNNQNVYELIFGEDKRICKIADADGEHVFGSISGALTYAQEHSLTACAVEMLVDYLLPASDPVRIPRGYQITLTTARTGENRYPNPGQRATISRDSENLGSMIQVLSGDQTLDTALTLRDLIIDGKSVRGNSDGGAVSAKFCAVTVENTDFYDVYAIDGGALYVAAGVDAGSGKQRAVEGSALTVRNASFIRCNSSKSNRSRNGGGAIHALVVDLTVEGCEFTGCEAYDQAGAVFHRIDLDQESATVITDCRFSDCRAKAAGGLELDSKRVTVTGCTFQHCVATERNAGGFNVYALNEANPAGDCWASVTDCTFDDCHATNLNSDNYGGGMRLTSVYTQVTRCRFTNTSAPNGGGLGISNEKAKTAVVSGCAFENCRSTKNGGAVYCRALSFTLEEAPAAAGSGTVAATVRNCTSSAMSGGGIYQNRNHEGSVFTLRGVTVQGCAAANKGGGVYSNARTVTLTDCVLSGNTAGGNGGGLLNENSSGTRLVTLERTTVQGNTSGGLGGGVYSNSKTLLRGETLITGNRLTTASVTDAAGLYLTDSLLVGQEGSAAADGSSVVNNTTVTGAASNTHLRQSGDNNHAQAVTVYSPLSGFIGVCNPGRVGTQFGSADQPDLPGLTDSDAVFRADASTLHGIIDRMDNNHQKIIWAGPPIAKVTDGEGNLLYKQPNGSDPAIYDRLSVANNNNAGTTSVCGLLNTQSPALYYRDGAPYTGRTFCVKLLAERVTAEYQLLLTRVRDLDVTFTTAGSDDRDGYPYQGRRGTAATIVRGSGMGNKRLLGTNGRLTVTHLVLDGNAAGLAGSQKGGLLDVHPKGSIVLGEGGIAQNADYPGGLGAGVYVNRDGASFTLQGGMIRRCSARVGGGVYVADNTASLRIESGNILLCTAQEKGGGVSFDGTSFIMNGGTIEQCSAQQGGGVFVNNARTFTMNGGFIVRNTATVRGGGIDLGDDRSRAVLSGKPTVTGNTLDGAANNLALAFDSNALIQIGAAGLQRGARIGVYVDGDFVQPADEETARVQQPESQFVRHGIQGAPFGTIPAGAAANNLYGFVNDRNGYKGGLVGEHPGNVCWVRIFSLEVAKQVTTSENAMTGSDSQEQEFRFRVRLSGTAADGSSGEAVNGEHGEMAFSGGVATFTLKDGEVLTGEDLPQGLTYSVEEISSGNYVPVPGRVQTGTLGEMDLPGVPPAQRYVSSKLFINMKPVCKVTNRAGNLLYVYDGEKDARVPAVFTELQTAFTALQGEMYLGESPTASPYALGQLYHVEMLVPEYELKVPLTVASGKTVTLRTASTSGDFSYQGPAGTVSTVRRGFSGASVLTVEGGGSLTLENLTLDGDKEVASASQSGGLVLVQDRGRLDVRGGATLRNARTALNGGAVAVNAGGVMTFTGGVIRDNLCDGNGAGVYLAAGSELRLSGSPSFGGTDVNALTGVIQGRAGNFVSASLADGTRNGGMNYLRPRQDIFLAEHGEDDYSGDQERAPASLVVDGPLTAPAGSIWVWAQSQYHYATLRPFARTTGTGAGFGAFRNARPDADTGCGGDTYLSGSGGDDPGLVYWSGGVDVFFRKTDGFGKLLAGAQFTVYRDAACTQPASITVNRQSAAQVTTRSTVEPGTPYNAAFSAAPGVYYLKETRVPAGFAENPALYRLVIGPAAAAQVGAQLPADGEYLFQQMADADTVDASGAEVGRYGILDRAAPTHKVILRKVDGAFEPLAGARLDLLRADRTPVARDLTSDGDTGVFWIGQLEEGVYLLHETAVPAGMAGNSGRGWWYTLRVEPDGVSISAARATEPVIR